MHGYLRIYPQTIGTGFTDDKDAPRTIRTGFTDRIVVFHDTQELMERFFFVNVQRSPFMETYGKMLSHERKPI